MTTSSWVYNKKIITCKCHFPPHRHDFKKINVDMLHEASFISFLPTSYHSRLKEFAAVVITNGLWTNISGSTIRHYYF